MPIRAVTFDFWRTLFRDSLSRERHRARIAALVEFGQVEAEQAKAAMKHTMAEFLRIHIVEQRTLRPPDAIRIVETYLGRGLAPESYGPLAEAFSLAVLEHRPEPIDGALDAVRAAAELVPVGLISDTGISPGSSLEVLLDDAQFRPHFTGLTFSDRVGAAKPQESMFADAADQLGVKPAEIFHIGDLEPTDVAGALAVGGVAGLFAGDNDRYVEGSKAHHVFRNWDDFRVALPEILSGGN